MRGRASKRVGARRREGTKRGKMKPPLYQDPTLSNRSSLGQNRRNDMTLYREDNSKCTK